MEVLLEDVEIQYPGHGGPLLRTRRLQIQPGEHILLRGASGSGKTSLLQAMSGLTTPASGDIQLGGFWLRNLSDDDRTRLRREGVGFIFQRLNILDHLTALENVLLGSPGAPLPVDRARASLAEVGLERQQDQLAWQLSLGEQQRVAVARVLATRPRLIIADEPTSSLDEANAFRVMDCLLQAAAEGTTLIVATHDPRIADRFSRVWQVENGTISDVRSPEATDTP